MQKTIWLICVLLGLISVFKVSFFVGLTSASLNPGQNDHAIKTFLKKNGGRNKNLIPLMMNYTDDKLFLAQMTVELLRKDIISRQNIYDKSFGAVIAESFPDNIFLDELQIYSPNTQDQTWQNFDPLFFEILKCHELNSFSEAVVFKSVKNNRMSGHQLFFLIQFLNWQKNPDLADQLQKWGVNQSLLNPRQIEQLDEIQIFRKTELETAELLPDPQFIRSILHSNLGSDFPRINLGPNLILDSSFIEVNSLSKYWNFVDMSDYAPFSEGCFYGNIDIPGDNSIRLMGFFTLKDLVKSPPRAGFQYIDYIRLKKTSYILFFRYCTSQEQVMPSYYLGKEFPHEIWLETTNLKWKNVIYIFNNDILNRLGIRLLFRMWGIGSVWFSHIYLGEIDLQDFSFEKDIHVIQ